MGLLLLLLELLHVELKLGTLKDDAVGAARLARAAGEAGKDAASRAHFDEKLLLLRGLMRTGAGRAMAERRHAVMAQFLEHFDAEVKGEA